jgi:hypothetical protein
MRPLAVVALALLGAWACVDRTHPGAAARSDEAQFARETLALLLRGEAPAVRARMSPHTARQATPDAMDRMLAERPPGAPGQEPRLVRFDQVVTAEVRRADFTFEYTYPQGYLLATVVVDTSDGAPRVTGVHLKRMALPAEQLNAFRLSGKSPRHYAMLAAALLAPAVIAYALVACLRTPGLRFAGAWLAFIAIGLGALTLNWSTGRLAVRPTVLVGGVSLWAAGPYAPWRLSVSLPVGALAFLALRRRRSRAAAASRLE